MAGTRPIEGSLRPPRTKMPKPPPEPIRCITVEDPPDMSCGIIPEKQLLKEHGESSAKDPQTGPVTLPQEMQGFGRFRRSVHADADWELNKFREELQTLGPAAILHLGDFEIAELNSSVMNDIRTPSCISLTSYFDSGDSSTHPRVYRGFHPRRSSLYTKSCREPRHSSINTNSHCTSPDRHNHTSTGPPLTSSRSSFLRLAAGCAQLATINETTTPLPKKKIVPLIFDEEAAADAVIDDDEYESFEDSFAPQRPAAKADKQEPAAQGLRRSQTHGQIPQFVLPQRNRGSRNYRTFSHGVEKARPAQRKATKHVTKRLSSRGARGPVNRAVSNENISNLAEPNEIIARQAPPSSNHSDSPPVIFSPRLHAASSNASTETSDIPAELTLYMGRLNDETTNSKENDDILHRSTSAQSSVSPEIPPICPLQTGRGRDGSNTAIRVASGNIPRVHLEDNRRLNSSGEACRIRLEQMVA
jgi:hypothetical protein